MNAIILFSYSMIESIDTVEPFYHHLFRGKTPDHSINNGMKLFKSLGTCDPLASTTKRIGKALVRRLEKATDEPWTFYIGSKHTAPFMEDIAKQCVDDGVCNIITVPTTPLYTKSGTRQYERALEKALKAEKHIVVRHLSYYYHDDAFIEVLSGRLNDAICWLAEDIRKEAEIIFTVHSMPGLASAHQEFIIQYEHLAKRLAEEVAFDHYQLAYRSGGPSPQRWLGPDILDVIKYASQQGKKAIIACDLLSIVANAEVIQEVGRDGQELAHSLNMEFVQTEYLNDSDDYITVLENRCLSPQ